MFYLKRHACGPPIYVRWIQLKQGGGSTHCEFRNCHDINIVTSLLLKTRVLISCGESHEVVSFNFVW